MEQSSPKIRFPFIINRRKAVVIEATSLANAVDRVTTKHPNKWIRTKYARNVSKHLKHMDLINAQQKVKADSKAKKNVLFYIVLVDDEFEVRTHDKVDIDKDDVYSTWRDGVKIDSPKENNEPLTKTETTTTMKTKSKKAVKKTAPKKAAKKPVAKNGTARKFPIGKVVNISIADMRANMKKGFFYRDPQGVRQTEAYMKTRAKQEYVREGMHEYKEEKVKKGA